LTADRPSQAARVGGPAAVTGCVAEPHRPWWARSSGSTTSASGTRTIEGMTPLTKGSPAVTAPCSVAIEQATTRVVLL